MSNLKDNVQDPDYAIAGPSRQQKTFEETALINKTKRITSIIEREFDRSINEKDKEIVLINNRLHEAIRTLSLLRYAIISEFYNRKECQTGTTSDSKQARIHPAIKQIIGKAPRNLRHRGNDTSNFITNSGASSSNSSAPQNGIPGPSHQNLTPNHQNILHSHQNLAHSHQNLDLNHQTLISNHQNDKNPAENNQLHRKNHEIPLHSNQNNNHKELNHQNYHHPGLNSTSLKRKNPQDHSEILPKKLCPNNEPEFQRGDGFRETRLIVIGNISTPIPPMDRTDDKYTHKWQVYVREKDNDKISEYISKVVFQLHPSYKPNDIIEVDRAPFNLVRRGWGNFSMNVTLIFKNKSNLPRAFVHNLTLDHVSETIYGLKIFPTNYSPPNYEPEESSSGEDNEEIDIENNDDYQMVTLNKKEVMNNIYLEHRYINIQSIGELNKTINHSGIKSMKNKRDLIKNINPCNYPNGDRKNLMVSNVFQPLGIEIPDETPKVKQVLVFNDKQIPLNFNKDKKQNGNGVSILKKNIVINVDPKRSVLLNAPCHEPALKIVDKLSWNYKKKKTDYSLRLREDLMEFQGQNVEKIVKFLAKRLPIVSKEQDLDYKRSFPYTCNSVMEFLGFNIAKQRSVEWYRAKEIRNLMKLKVKEEEMWSTKEILIWCRLQGFTAVRAKFGSAKREKEEVNSCTEARELVEWVKKMKSSGDKEEVEVIDIEGDEEIRAVREDDKEFVRLEMSEEESKMNFFVTETARQVEVKLGDEEIVEGVRDCTAGRVVAKALECLLEDLLRSSLSKAWERNNLKPPDVITVSDVRSAVNSREEFDIFTNYGLGTTQ